MLAPDAPTTVIAGPLVRIGVGFELSLAVMDGTAVSAVAPGRVGMAAGLFNTARLAGEAIATDAFGALLTAATTTHLRQLAKSNAAHRATGQLLRGDMAGALTALHLAGDCAAAVGAYTSAMHTALWRLTALMAFGTVAIAALTCPQERRAHSTRAPWSRLSHKGAAVRVRDDRVG